MIKGVSYSRVHAVAGSTAIAAACAMLWMHWELKSEYLEHMRRASGAEASLAARISSMAEYDDGKLEAMRDQVGRLRLLLGTDDTWQSIVKKFGEGWTAELGPREERSSFSIQYGVLKLKSPAIADWPEIIARLRASEALPGVGIVEFEMNTSGNRERRSLDLVRVVVAVQTRKTGANLAESR